MREILFRGKRTDCGEWVEGDLIEMNWHNKPSTYCIMPKTPVTYNYPVISETVGQYTGLTDKNGVRIFEGDIVRFGDGKILVVVYENSFTGFIAREPGENYCRYLSRGALTIAEVLGNIHDNPELLEGGEGDG